MIIAPQPIDIIIIIFQISLFLITLSSSEKMCVRLSASMDEKKYGTFENVGCAAPDKWHYLPVR